MKKIGDTELIINNENRIYHLNLKKEEVADKIILVGDPSRVSQVSNKFEKILFKIQHREFITHTGIFNNKKISVISSGIGTDNIDIVLNELDAIVNIDLKTKKINDFKKSLDIVRLGTSGSLNNNINLDTFIASEYAIGFDGLAHFYDNDIILEKKLQNEFINHTKWDVKHALPYALKASNNLLKKFDKIKKGITLTATGFYAPQTRELRLNSSVRDLYDKIKDFKYNKCDITNFEMETSALYFLGKSLGHNTLTLCAVLGNRLEDKQSNKPLKTINKLIDIVLERL